MVALAVVALAVLSGLMPGVLCMADSVPDSSILREGQLSRAGETPIEFTWPIVKLGTKDILAPSGTKEHRANSM